MRFINSVEELPPLVQAGFLELQAKYRVRGLMWCKVVSAGHVSVYQFIRKYGSGTRTACLYDNPFIIPTSKYMMNYFDYESLVRSYGQPTFDPRATAGALPYMWRS